MIQNKFIERSLKNPFIVVIIAVLVIVMARCIDNDFGLQEIVLIIVGSLLSYTGILISNRMELYQIGRRWKRELEFLDLALEKQIENFESFSKKVKSNPYNAFDLELSTGLDCQVLNSLDKDKFVGYLDLTLSATQLKENPRLSNTIFGLISSVSQNFELSKSSYNKGIEKISEEYSSLNSNLNQIYRQYGKYLVKLEKRTDNKHIEEQGEMSTLFDSYIKPLQEEGIIDLANFKANFLLPLLEILSKLRHDIDSHLIAEKANALIMNLNMIKLEEGYLIENANKYSKRLNESRDSLKNKVLKKLPRK